MASPQLVGSELPEHSLCAGRMVVLERRLLVSRLGLRPVRMVFVRRTDLHRLCGPGAGSDHRRRATGIATARLLCRINRWTPWAANTRGVGGVPIRQWSCGHFGGR